MARITGSHLVCKALQLEGVKNIFGLAATTSCRCWTSWRTKIPHHRYAS